MSEFNIEVEGGSSVRLPTGGKYCPKDIIVTAKGGGSTGGGDIDAFIDGSMTEVDSGATSIRSYALYRSPVASGNFPNAISVGKYAFSYCDNLITVSLPNAADFDTYVFYYSKALKTICLPKAKSIGMRMFYACYDLESVDFHTATSIGQEVFVHCSELISVTLRSQTVCTLDSVNSFQSLYKFLNEDGPGRIYVPSNLVDAYKSATNWSSLASKIVAIEGEGGGEESWLFEDMMIDTSGNNNLPTPVDGVSYTAFVDGEEIATSTCTGGVLHFNTEDYRIYLIYDASTGLGWHFHPIDSSVSMGNVSIRINE